MNVYFDEHKDVFALQSFIDLTVPGDPVGGRPIWTWGEIVLVSGPEMNRRGRDIILADLTEFPNRDRNRRDCFGSPFAEEEAEVDTLKMVTVELRSEPQRFRFRAHQRRGKGDYRYLGEYLDVPLVATSEQFMTALREAYRLCSEKL